MRSQRCQQDFALQNQHWSRLLAYSLDVTCKYLPVTEVLREIALCRKIESVQKVLYCSGFRVSVHLGFPRLPHETAAGQEYMLIVA